MNGHHRAVLLDSYGTLVRPSNPLPWYRRLVGLASEYGVTVDESTARSAARAALDFLNRQLPVHTVEEERRMYHQYYRILLEQIGVWVDVERRAAALWERFRVRECWLQPFEETVPVLEALSAAGYRLAVVSDGFPSLRSDYERLGLSKYFTCLVVASEVGAWKPDRRVYERALTDLGISVGECVYLDDNEADATGAAALGIESYLLDRDGRHNGSGLPRVGSLREFASAIGVPVE